MRLPWKKRRPRPDYAHIHQLEIEAGLIEADPPKRELVPVTGPHALSTLSAKLDPKTGGFILEKHPELHYVGSAASSAYFPVPLAARGLLGSGHAAEMQQMQPGAVWPVWPSSRSSRLPPTVTRET